MDRVWIMYETNSPADKIPSDLAAGDRIKANLRVLFLEGHFIAKSSLIKTLKKSIIPPI
jgi:hypothetical protein